MKIPFFPNKLRLRHVAFLLVALAGIALTTFTIIILWRISAPGIINDRYSGKDFIGIIGVLVAFVAAFIGIMVTIMFADVLYNHIETAKKLKEINNLKNSISDLYVLTLRTEAIEKEKDRLYMNALERRLGVLYKALGMPNVSDRYILHCIEEIKNNVDSLELEDMVDNYGKNKSKDETLLSIKSLRNTIDLRIDNILKCENSGLIESDIRKIKEIFDSKMDIIIPEIEKKFMKQ